MNRQVANIESAYAQGYLRDAISDLDQLIAVIQIGAQRSPAFHAMRASLELLKKVIQGSEQARPQQELLELLKAAQQAVLQANEPTQVQFAAEARKMYSYAATQSESGLADELFRNR